MNKDWTKDKDDGYSMSEEECTIQVGMESALSGSGRGWKPANPAHAVSKHSAASAKRAVGSSQFCQKGAEDSNGKKPLIGFSHSLVFRKPRMMIRLVIVKKDSANP